MELIIKKEFFNPLFINFNIPTVKRPTFFNITYNSPTIELEGLFFETPWMTSLYGPILYDTRDSNKYHIELSFKGYQNDSQLRNFFSCLNGIDRRVNNFLFKNKNYLKLSNKIDSYYNKQVRFISDMNESSKVDSIIKVKLFKNMTETYLKDQPNQKYDFSDIIGNKTKVKAFIKCNGLWYYSGKFGLSWKAYKLIVDRELSTTNESDNQNERPNQSNLETPQRQNIPSNPIIRNSLEDLVELTTTESQIISDSERELQFTMDSDRDGESDHSEIKETSPNNNLDNLEFENENNQNDTNQNNNNQNNNNQGLFIEVEENNDEESNEANVGFSISRPINVPKLTYAEVSRSPPINIPSSVGSIGEENEYILSKFS